MSQNAVRAKTLIVHAVLWADVLDVAVCVVEWDGCDKKWWGGYNFFRCDSLRSA